MIQLMQGDCLELMSSIPDGSVDLTVTSPPYDNLRSYNNSLHDWNQEKWTNILKELFRVTANGGVVVWVVADATIKGSETGTSFRQALSAMDIGFNLHDTMIFQKAGTGACGSNLAYWQSFDYMFVFSKGRPKTVNRIADQENARAGVVCTRGRISADGEEKDKKRRVIPNKSVRSNIWRLHAGNNGDGKINHPARFPLQLANDHVLSWSNRGDVVLDPFLGSGTTGVACINTDRNFIGIERDEKYFQIAKERINAAKSNPQG